jgi:hypothetical protein
VTSICLRLAQGEPLAQICREDGMPCLVTVWNWQKADPSVSERIARAREAGFDQIAQDALDIADDGSRDYKPSEDGRELPDHDHIQRSKLRVETRLKLLAKWDPKRYGERIAQELTGKDGGPIKTEDVGTPEGKLHPPGRRNSRYRSSWLIGVMMADSYWRTVRDETSTLGMALARSLTPTLAPIPQRQQSRYG